MAPVHGTGLTDWHYMSKTQIDWHSYRQQVFKEAEKENRPLFVLIYADWCEWCKKYEQDALETKPIQQRLSTDYIPVAVDYDKEKALAKSLGARLVPTTLLITPTREKLARLYGHITTQDLSEILDRTLALWRRGEIPENEFGSEETCCPLPVE